MTAHKTGLIKKHKTKPVQKDFSALDAAVEELTRHNAMLERQINGDTDTDHPQLPTKRRIHPATKGRSMDIVHPGGRAKKPSHTKIDHLYQTVAARSRVQTPVSSQAAAAVKSQSTAVGMEPEVDKLSEPLFPEALHTVEKHLDSQEKQSPVEEPNPEPIKKAVAAELPTEESSDEAADQIGELYANNLVQSSNPAGYTPHKTQPDLAVFDAEDYHAQLHDWSRLAHRSSWQYVALFGLLLLVLSVLLLRALVPDFLPDWVGIPGF